jgi:hypothetical protein
VRALRKRPLTIRKLASDHELRLRVTVDHPPAGVMFMLQRGARELDPPAHTTQTSIVFEFVVRVGERQNGEPNFLGPFAQGPPASRFVYVNSGTLAGQRDTCWSRRAKVPLTAITWSTIEHARAADAALETHIAGTGRDGGPACASVPLVGGWRVAAR